MTDISVFLKMLNPSPEQIREFMEYENVRRKQQSTTPTNATGWLRKPGKPISGARYREGY